MTHETLPNSPERDGIEADHPAKAFLVKWSWLRLVLVLTLILFGIALLGIALLPARQFAFSATLKCSSLEVRLPEGWPEEYYFPAKRIYLDGVEATSDWQGRSWSYERDGGDRILSVDSGTIQLDDTYSQGPQTLSLSANSGILTFSLRDSCSGIITADSAGSDATTYTQWSLIPGGSISFQPRNTNDFDAVDRLPFDEIKFLALEPDSEQMGSTIQSGEIKIQGKKEPLTTLRTKDYLILEGISQGEISIRLIEDSSLEVRIQGNAREGRSGLHTPLISLKPTRFDKFLHEYFDPIYSDYVERIFVLFGALGISILGYWSKFLTRLKKIFFAKK